MPECMITRRRLTRRHFTVAGTMAGSFALAGPRIARGATRPLREATFPVLLRFTNHNPAGRYPPLDAAADLTTPASYISSISLRVPYSGGGSRFDHSDAGIQRAAAAVAKTVSYQAKASRSGITMFDIESNRSFNVPGTFYDAARDYDRAARYDHLAAPELRGEAVRYQTRLMAACQAQLVTSVPSFEPGAYNVPGPINFYTAFRAGQPAAIGSKQAADLRPTLLPALSFTGPQCRLNISQVMSDRIRTGAITLRQLIDMCAISVATASKTVEGSGARVMPCLWPRYWALSGARYPNGSAALPAGFYTDFCNALLDAGAQGFSIWTPKVDSSLSAAEWAGLMSSWAEVVAVCRARGFRKLSAT
jgi:hypothetical protein